MIRQLVLSACVLGAFATSSMAQNTTAGGLSPHTVGANETSLLETALSSETGYQASVTQRLCYTKIASLETQVVSGMMYYFHVDACELPKGSKLTGKCDASCEAKRYTVKVYEQSWTNTVQVADVQEGDVEAATSGSTESDGHLLLGHTQSGNSSSGDMEPSTNASTVPSPTPDAASRLFQQGIALGVVVVSLVVLC
ncbi:hypothetical protein Poli38472_002724 [Pythium oligandrum]|uniref:Uncharacterized protein n=1 Tax=Pythium oligandrum TaxID=41045 RepID=A0A8K1CIX5_PYTOL|nr:hypothetical protein Poli38472_002724 [Pythium oligandrum]|eukprot:TMW63783.1 hypothetical protein Poli38472_002724 [Pythium oligandrum]